MIGNGELRGWNLYHDHGQEKQVFRVDAAIYNHANPYRSAEIGQYVFVINSAASTYTWENVNIRAMLGIVQKFQRSSALPNIKYNFIVLILRQMY